jgi:hypothetical protein
MNHFLTRQLGMLQVELEELYEADVFSDLADLDYLSKLKTRLAILIKELAAGGQVEKDPSGVLKKDWMRAKKWTTGLNGIVDKLDSSLNELKERKEWTQEELKEEQSALGSSHEEFEKELDILNRKYFKKKTDWTGKNSGDPSDQNRKFDLFIKTGNEFKGKGDIGWSFLYWAFVNHTIDCSKILRAIEIIRNASDSTKSEAINYVNTHHSIREIAERYKEKLPPSKRFFEIRSEITKDEANGFIKQLGMAAVSAYEGAFLYGPPNPLSISNAADAITELIPVGSLNLLCPLLESFDSFEEEDGKGFGKLLNDAHQTYLFSAKKFKSVYKSKSKDVEKYLESQQKILKDVPSLVEEGEEAWKKGELEKVKIFLSKISLFPQFAIELRKSYETYENAYFVVSSYCESISRIKSTLSEQQGRMNYSLSEEISKELVNLFLTKQIQNFLEGKNVFLSIQEDRTVQEARTRVNIFSKYDSFFDFYDRPIEQWNEEERITHYIIYGDDNKLDSQSILTFKWVEAEKLGKNILSYFSDIDKCFHFTSQEIFNSLSPAREDLVNCIKVLPQLSLKELSSVSTYFSTSIPRIKAELAQMNKAACTEEELVNKNELAIANAKRSRIKKYAGEKGCSWGCLIFVILIFYYALTFGVGD